MMTDGEWNLMRAEFVVMTNPKRKPGDECGLAIHYPAHPMQRCTICGDSLMPGQDSFEVSRRTLVMEAVRNHLHFCRKLRESFETAAVGAFGEQILALDRDVVLTVLEVHLGMTFEPNGFCHHGDMSAVGVYVTDTRHLMVKR